jgi:hypothetical protein
MRMDTFGIDYDNFWTFYCKHTHMLRFLMECTETSDHLPKGNIANGWARPAPNVKNHWLA